MAEYSEIINHIYCHNYCHTLCHTQVTRFFTRELRVTSNVTDFKGWVLTFGQRPGDPANGVSAESAFACGELPFLGIAVRAIASEIWQQTFACHTLCHM